MAGSSTKRFLGVGVANSISLGRMFLAVGVIALLFQPEVATVYPSFYQWAFWLTAIVIWLDGVDGYLARKLGETSPSGAVIDILADRAVEQIYWVSFAALGWVPLWMPLVVIVRGIWVDGLRALALQQGFTAFGSTSLMQHPVGVLLVSSRFSRWTYAVAKAVAFAFLIAAHTPGNPIWVNTVAQISVWVTVIFCLVRGLPVLIEGRRFL